MLDGHSISLRARLRRETVENHARVDACFSTLDLKEPGGLSAFLSAHGAAFAAIQSVLPAEPGLVDTVMLSEMITAIDDDLRILGGKRTALICPPVGYSAIDHIILGSRLGTAVLRKEWAASRNQQVRAASHYFSLSNHGDAWKAHVRDLEGLSATDAHADDVILDTKRLYHLFESAFHVAK